jgi:Lon protease-like protein
MSATLTATATLPVSLPDTLAIFPIPGAVLLPRARLPLHIFEPRYLSMIDDVLGTPSRMIGMIQPTEETDDRKPDRAAIYSVGCAGRITSFAETEDGRFMIGLTGLCRFEVEHELDVKTPYRKIHPNWDRFLDDLKEPAEVSIDHARLSMMLQPYFKSQSMEADWIAIESMADETLVATLTMICPFAPNEKQALLEAPDLASRAEMLMALLEMAAMPPADGNAKH